MDQQGREQAFMNALASEHFVLQAARSAIVGDQVGRATIYIGAVSGALIAFGFLAQVVTRLDPFVIAVLPALFVLGELTFAAMWHNTVEWSCPRSVDTLTLGTSWSLERSPCATNPSALSAGVPR